MLVVPPSVEEIPKPPPAMLSSALFSLPIEDEGEDNPSTKNKLPDSGTILTVLDIII